MAALEEAMQAIQSIQDSELEEESLILYAPD